ncbi:hypothetical protein LY76DRAFT_644322 [Colletotrichum caudatum]|nr:hypothetical protein LY76DRAFT_644322 [Colletotrichum caudatum]
MLRILSRAAPRITVNKSGIRNRGLPIIYDHLDKFQKLFALGASIPTRKNRSPAQSVSDNSSKENAQDTEEPYKNPKCDAADKLLAVKSTLKNLRNEQRKLVKQNEEFSSEQREFRKTRPSKSSSKHNRERQKH